MHGSRVIEQRVSHLFSKNNKRLRDAYRVISIAAWGLEILLLAIVW